MSADWVESILTKAIKAAHQRTKIICGKSLIEEVLPEDAAEANFDSTELRADLNLLIDY